MKTVLPLILFLLMGVCDHNNYYYALIVSKYICNKNMYNFTVCSSQSHDDDVGNRYWLEEIKCL